MSQGMLRNTVVDGVRVSLFLLMKVLESWKFWVELRRQCYRLNWNNGKLYRPMFHNLKLYFIALTFNNLNIILLELLLYKSLNFEVWSKKKKKLRNTVMDVMKYGI